MPALSVEMKAPTTRDQGLLPGDLAIDATFTNTTGDATYLNVHQASHPALVLEVRDARNELVRLAPPSAPDADDLAPGQELKPGESVSLHYAGFLDRGLAGGAYRVRYSSPYPALGGSPDDPLQSPWVGVMVRGDEHYASVAALERPWLVIVRQRAWVLSVLLRWWFLIWCFIRQRLGLLRCDRVLTREVDEARSETISNAPPGSEAWNGTYGWRARFALRLDDSTCRAEVTVRVRLNGNLSQVQRVAWQTAINNAWSNRFKLCTDSCCCTSGYTIVAALQLVTSGEHQVVNVGTSTTNMGNWGASDIVDINHEYGHMLGALDEYFTVNGVNYGAGRQPSGAIMNNPANSPVARHYDLIRTTVEALAGAPCSTLGVGTPCP